MWLVRTSPGNSELEVVANRLPVGHRLCEKIVLGGLLIGAETRPSFTDDGG